MRRSLVLLVVIAGCAADPDAPDPVAVERMDPVPVSLADGEVAPDLCALAAQLPTDDICSLICDPDALADQLAADGNERGFCYQLSCSLPEGAHALVGVCLAP